jgi:hypothetical protein
VVNYKLIVLATTHGSLDLGFGRNGDRAMNLMEPGTNPDLTGRAMDSCAIARPECGDSDRFVEASTDAGFAIITALMSL